MASLVVTIHTFFFDHASELWSIIHDHFQQFTRARARKLRYELRATLHENRTVEEYLVRIKMLSGSLDSTGDHLPLHRYIDVILEGFPQYYSHVISVIESKI